MTQITEDFKNYRLIHNFISDEPLKAWINEGCFNDIYKADWNALMEVVEKIESLGFPVTIYIEGVYIESAETGKDICRMNLETCHETSKRDRTYKAIVEFIKWYNQNK